MKFRITRTRDDGSSTEWEFSFGWGSDEAVVDEPADAIEGYCDLDALDAFLAGIDPSSYEVNGAQCRRYWKASGE
jgi:hypothetical protein